MSTQKQNLFFRRIIIMENTKIKDVIRAEQRAYMKKWRSQNKEKVREINNRYWEKRALRILEKKAEGENNG